MGCSQSNIALENIGFYSRQTMTQKLIKKQDKPARGKIRELLIKDNNLDPDKVDLKRAQLLALLKNRYGYTNDKAVDELERLLKQFYRTNKNLGIHRIQPNLKNPNTE